MKISPRVPALVFGFLLVTLSAADAPKPWPPDQFLPVTAERIEKLPLTEQPAWRAYLIASQARAQWLAGETFAHEDMHPVIQQAVNHAVAPLKRFRCASCGFEANRHFWHCPGCQAWDSFPPRRIEER